MINPLDQAVADCSAALQLQSLPNPDALFFLGTGIGVWLDSLEVVVRIPLPHAPHPWTEETLTVARMGDLHIWILEDLGDDPRFPSAPAWRGGFPVWLAARCGASVIVHTSAGSILDAESSGLQAGGLGVVRDHLNLSGRTPLTALGESQLGPLFPDQSLLHDGVMRDASLKVGSDLGVGVDEVIVACTAGPSLETSAERAWYRAAGADVAVQGLATPVHAAAHAGLSGLFLIALTDAGERPVRVKKLARVAEQMQPSLASFLCALEPALEVAVRNLSRER